MCFKKRANILKLHTEILSKTTSSTKRDAS
jgi:hypothetical protein